MFNMLSYNFYRKLLNKTIINRSGSVKVFTSNLVDRILFETQPPVVNSNVNVKIKQKCFNGREEQIEINGKKIFKNLNNRQKARMNRVFGEAAKKSSEVFEFAVDVANSLGCDNQQQFLSVVEIIGADERITSTSKANIPQQIKNIRADYDNYVQTIKEDLKIATEIANRRDLNFKDQYKAVYHYRKHGSEFPSEINSQPVELYLNDVPNKLITDYNLIKITNNQVRAE